MLPRQCLSFCSGMAIAMSFALLGPRQALAQGSVECAAPAGMERHFQSGKLILMGEIHGTNEDPAAFGTVVCDALKHGQTVSAGLELFPAQVEPLATYLASDGGTTAAAQLLHSPFWTRTFQDGRSSIAMLGLIERLRMLKQRYPDLAVFVLEEDVGVPRSSASLTRDQKMAARVRMEHERRPQALVLTLSGNIHNRLKPMPSADGERAIDSPMGTLLTDLAPRSVLLAHTGGTAWICTPECDVRVLPALGKPQGEAQPTYRALTSAEPYTEEWLLGPSTASRPAAQLGR